MAKEPRRGRLGPCYFGVATALILAWYTFQALLMHDGPVGAALGVLPLLVVTVVNGWIASASRLSVSDEGVAYKMAGRLRRADWRQVTAFVLTDDYRVKLYLAKGRSITFAPARFEGGREIVEDLRAHLGKPAPKKSGLATLSWGAPLLLAVLSASMFSPLLSLDGAYAAIVIAFLLGCAVGVLGSVFLSWKGHQSLDKSDSKYVVRVVIDVWGIMVGVPVIMALFGVHSGQAFLLIAAFVVGRLLSAGLLALLTRRRDGTRVESGDSIPIS